MARAGRGVASPAASTDDVALSQQSNSALASAKRNFRYFVNPSTSATIDRPTRLRTRALLRSVRYIGQFIIWRLVRWARYAAVGALVAAVSASALGGMITGVGWLAAPPTFGASIMAASIWGVGKYVARKLHRRWQDSGKDEGEVQREYQQDHPVLQDGRLDMEVGPRAVPW